MYKAKDMSEYLAYLRGDFKESKDKEIKDDTVSTNKANENKSKDTGKKSKQ